LALLAFSTSIPNWQDCGKTFLSSVNRVIIRVFQVEEARKFGDFVPEHLIQEIKNKLGK
jgi:hypothetical protein